MRPNRPFSIVCFKKLNGRIAAVLLDHEQSVRPHISSQALTMRNPSCQRVAIRLFRDDVALGRGDLDGLLGLQAARRGQDEDVGRSFIKQGLQIALRLGTGY